MPEEIPLKPLGREEIHKLETALLVGTLLRPDVLEEIRKSEERITWIDSLAVAAGALARQRAGMTTSEIAEDLGRSEGTIRNHLTGRTRAGKLVKETYERIAREGFKVTIPVLGVSTEELQKLKKRIQELEKQVEELTSEVANYRRIYDEERRKREILEDKLGQIAERLKDLMKIISK